MIDERLNSAIGRVERAISRLEDARDATAEPADPAPADGPLAERHAALRERTAEAIARLDALLCAPAAEADAAAIPDDAPPAHATAEDPA